MGLAVCGHRNTKLGSPSCQPLRPRGSSTLLDSDVGKDHLCTGNLFSNRFSGHLLHPLRHPQHSLTISQEAKHTWKYDADKNWIGATCHTRVCCVQFFGFLTDLNFSWHSLSGCSLCHCLALTCSPVLGLVAYPAHIAHLDPANGEESVFI